MEQCKQNHNQQKFQRVSIIQEPSGYCLIAFFTCGHPQWMFSAAGWAEEFVSLLLQNHMVLVDADVAAAREHYILQNNLSSDVILVTPAQVLGALDTDLLNNVWNVDPNIIYLLQEMTVRGRQTFDRQGRDTYIKKY